MSATESDVIVTQYRAEFRAAPYGRPRWEVVGGWQYRETLPRRRRWTVVRDYRHHAIIEPAAKRPNTGIGHMALSALIDPDAITVFVPDAPGSRFGTAVLVEQIARRS